MLWNPAMRDKYPVLPDTYQGAYDRLISFERKLALPGNEVLCQKFCEGILGDLEKVYIEMIEDQEAEALRTCGKWR
jgi:hypothetical protein